MLTVKLNTLNLMVLVGSQKYPIKLLLQDVLLRLHKKGKKEFKKVYKNSVAGF